MTNLKARQEAEHFLNHEKQFHLGVLPTEQSNPKTRDIDLVFAKSPAEGVAALLSVDRDIQHMAGKILQSGEFHQLVDAGVEVLGKGGNVVFSGCGSTGRLSVLLETMWRYFFRLGAMHPDIHSRLSHLEDRVLSIMTGGDYALVRSVEFFEDYQEFGKQQVRELGMADGDMLVAITEGGETSSVLGTAEEAADRGAKVFLLFNNPASVLVEHIKRSRRAIEDPRITVLELFCGPMAIAGSTRMQATTAGLLVAGAALEMMLGRSIRHLVTHDQQNMLNITELDYTEAYSILMDELSAPGSTDVLSKYIELEKKIYDQKGLVTYFANEFLLDIFTDTTERSPTFMLPPFRKSDDLLSPVSWAFVKSPLYPTSTVWEHVLGRPPRCLEWDSGLYRQMGAPENLSAAPPKLDRNEILKFLIGNEKDVSRLSRTPNMAVSIEGKREITDPGYDDYRKAFKMSASEFDRHYTLLIGRNDASADFCIDCKPFASALNLMERLAAKLVLNTISTGTMIMSGRVTGNWMTWVEVTNKKLRDRGIRLISEICGLSYRDACYALHETLEQLSRESTNSSERFSPVQHTIERCIPGAGHPHERP
jgi:N-acetylmuramic acid 6-phosphate etherase